MDFSPTFIDLYDVVQRAATRGTQELELKLRRFCPAPGGEKPIAGNEFQSSGRAIVKEDEFEEVRCDGIVSIVSLRIVFRLWWEERKDRSDNSERSAKGTKKEEEEIVVSDQRNQETWSLTLREEHRLRVFENKVVRKIFGAKRDEVTEEWRKLHNTELHALYSSPDIIRNIKSRRLTWTDFAVELVCAVYQQYQQAQLQVVFQAGKSFSLDYDHAGHLSPGSEVAHEFNHRWSPYNSALNRKEFRHTPTRKLRNLTVFYGIIATSMEPSQFEEEYHLTAAALGDDSDNDDDDDDDTER
ncbi:hypothetical protein ANN_10510 [Periplaneta americana]|uniref:Uncharacterized protein n=1 Tax=Periplaneta americana TaxID=6978 RepID=A0ABQ8TP78_PERAM|nr:hypothetical protein ANN_10510 [Periplaneta americana]